MKFFLMKNIIELLQVIFMLTLFSMLLILLIYLSFLTTVLQKKYYEQMNVL